MHVFLVTLDSGICCTVFAKDSEGRQTWLILAKVLQN